MEFVRHRVFSFAQESTRYCNYSKDKFGNELTFIIPSWMGISEDRYEAWEFLDMSREDRQKWKHKNKINSENEWNAFHSFLTTLTMCEENYLSLIDQGWTPQQARDILPIALKTELVMTGFISDWEHFFELRCDKKAHPDGQVLANELKNKFIEKGWITQ